MEWAVNTHDDIYTLGHTNCEAMVWPDSPGLWQARIQRMGVEVARDTFHTRPDAQAWCVTRLKELDAAGKCSD